MSSQAGKPLVLVIGGTGNTGQPIISSLLEHGSFRVAALTRPSSVTKPVVKTLKSQDVEIRVGDFASDSPEQLQLALVDVDILISIVSAKAIRDQTNVLSAAKRAGVKRVIPCDFGTACPPGLRDLYDDKLFIRSFIREIGLPYTFIDVGWWMQLSLPHPPSSPAGWNTDISREYYGSGNIKTAVTDLYDIGKFVALIIGDPRTLNQYVFCWGEEVTQNEAYEIADRISGQKLSDLRVHITDEEILHRAATGKAEYIRDSSGLSQSNWMFHQYVYSMYVRGDNTLEKAKAQGALDARELYSNLKPRTLQAVAKEFYSTQIPEFNY